VRIGNPGRPLNEADIEIFERELGATLPGSYRAFLLMYNGGVPQPNLITYCPSFHPIPKRDVVERFLSLGDDPTIGIAPARRNLNNSLPPNLLPIADTLGQSLVVLSISGYDAGRVYYWDYESLVDAVSYDNVYEVANSFDELLAGLKDG
jgi:hypothetical protein